MSSVYRRASIKQSYAKDVYLGKHVYACCSHIWGWYVLNLSCLCKIKSTFRIWAGRRNLGDQTTWFVVLDHQEVGATLGHLCYWCLEGRARPVSQCLWVGRSISAGEWRHTRGQLWNKASGNEWRLCPLPLVSSASWYFLEILNYYLVSKTKILF